MPIENRINGLCLVQIMEYYTATGQQSVSTHSSMEEFHKCTVEKKKPETYDFTYRMSKNGQKKYMLLIIRAVTFTAELMT